MRGDKAVTAKTATSPFVAQKGTTRGVFAMHVGKRTPQLEVQVQHIFASCAANFHTVLLNQYTHS